MLYLTCFMKKRLRNVSFFSYIGCNVFWIHWVRVPLVTFYCVFFLVLLQCLDQQHSPNCHFGAQNIHFICFYDPYLKIDISNSNIYGVIATGINKIIFPVNIIRQTIFDVSNISYIVSSIGFSIILYTDHILI